MNKRDLTRRGFVTQSLAAVGPAVVAANSLPLVSAQAEDTARISVVCVGGHPDDPESGGGGTLAPHPAPRPPGAVGYPPRGERGLPRQTPDHTPPTRPPACHAAPQITGAKPP